MEANQNEVDQEAFDAISQFVNDLWEVFGNNKKITPLALYKRIIEHINKKSDIKAVERAVTPFKKFVQKYDKVILNREVVPRGEKIYYGDNQKIYIDIESFIHRGDSETRSAIFQHLLTICAILNPSEEAFQELEKKESFPIEGKEGEFLSGMLNRAKTSMEGVDTNNPMVAFSALAESGIVGELFSGLQQGMASGQMDFKKMLGSMQGLINNMMDEVPEDSKPTIEEIIEEPLEESSEETLALPAPEQN